MAGTPSWATWEVQCSTPASEPGSEERLAVGSYSPACADQACGLGQVTCPLSGLLSVHNGDLPQLRCEGQVVHGMATSGHWSCLGRAVVGGWGSYIVA